MISAAMALLATPPRVEVVTVLGRSVTAVLPQCTDSAETDTIPLVISLHAWGSTSDSQQDVDRFANFTSSAKCFAFAYPEGLERAWGPFGLSGYSWNGGGCFWPSLAAGSLSDALAQEESTVRRASGLQQLPVGLPP